MTQENETAAVTRDVDIEEPRATLNILLLPGDGIGPDVIAEAVRVLAAVEQRCGGVSFEFSERSVGAGEFLKSGSPLSDETVEACRAADAVLLGAMGLPDVRWPDGKEMTPQIDLRERLDLYCGLRPIRLYHGDDTPLKGLKAGDIDLMIVRENTEGLFSARLSQQSEESGASDVMRITRRGTERICREAFKVAAGRRGKVACVDKANVLPSMVYFRSIFDEVAADFPNAQTEHIYVDAAALFLVRRPQAFDVLVAENMFGDILSDLAAGLIGGMGMAPSADIGDDCAVFQPSHGSAPDIAGTGRANPIATILSAAMMLDWLPQPSAGRGARIIRQAVEHVLADPTHRTADMGGALTTTQMGDAIVEAMANSSE